MSNERGGRDGRDELASASAMATAHYDTTDGGHALHNTLLPSSRLHSKILAKIFTTYAAAMIDDESYYRHPEIFHKPHIWISVAQVCRHWRTIALDSPRLWSFISRWTSASLVKMQISRSKQAPLYVQSMGPWSEEDAQAIGRFALIHSAISRIRELTFEVGLTETLRDVELPMTLGPAPLLQILTIDGHEESTDEELTPFTMLLYDGGAPALAKLEILSIPFTWRSSFQHPNLRELRINLTNIDLSDIHDSTITDMIVALGSMPLLETLELVWALPSYFPKSGPTDRRVLLPRLRSVSLTSNSINCANLFSYLDIPSETNISLIGGLEEPLVSDLCIAQIKGSPALQTFSFYPTQSTDHLGRMRYTASLEALPSETAGSEFQEPVKSSPSISLQLTSSCPDLQCCRELVAICEILPLSETRHFEMYCAPGMSRTIWMDAFKRMQNLRTLTLLDAPIFPLIHALFVPNDQTLGQSNNPPKPSLPLLEVLEFKYLWFRRKDRQDLELLRDGAAGKGRELVARVPNLTVSYCKNMDSYLEQLLRDTIAVTVKWDGDERSSDWEDKYSDVDVP